MKIVAANARVTLDTNVYVSAFQFGGMRLLHMAVDGDIEIAVSEPIMGEVIRVLRDKFHLRRLQASRHPTTASSNAPSMPGWISSSPPTMTCFGWQASLDEEQ